MSKMLITVCVVLVLIGFSNCQKKAELHNILSNGCYWDIWDKGSPHPINSCYKFTKEGDCNYYYYNFYAKKRQNTVYLYNDADVIVPNKWEVLKDSIHIRANKYFVIRYSVDSVFLTSNEKDTMVLIKNCNVSDQSVK